MSQGEKQSRLSRGERGLATLATERGKNGNVAQSFQKGLHGTNRVNASHNGLLVWANEQDHLVNEMIYATSLASVF